MNNLIKNGEEFDKLIGIGQKENPLFRAPSLPLYITWDCETGPLSKENLVEFLDEKKTIYPQNPGVFDPKMVKYGNRTKPEARAEWLCQSRKRHVLETNTYKNRVKTAREEALQNLWEEAALHAHTNVLLAIGYGVLQPDGTQLIYLDCGNRGVNDENDEKELTKRLWAVENKVRHCRGKMFGYNDANFDWPLLQKRAWKYDVNAPIMLTKYNKLPDHCVDLSRIFSCGVYRSHIKLDYVARYLGVGQKMAEVTGDMFHKLFFGGEREKALEYLYGDIDVTFQVAKKLGQISTPVKTLAMHRSVV